ncbi:MAG: hypothetical protein LBV72_12045 [Tannerella sp.]|jgi:hypothetical protein|nr:hypothetical protein [Tannerella sp.]
MEIQKNFFETLKSKLPSHISLAHEVSDLLNISVDSAYRRIRGEKELSISELSTLCEHYDISVDAILNHRSNNIIFKKLYHQKNDLDEYYLYTKDVTERLELISTLSGPKEMYYLAREIPFFHLTPYPELALFRVFVCYQMNSKNDVSYDEFLDGIDRKKIMDYYHRMLLSYNKIPSKEIWVRDTADATLQLLEYYYELNMFRTPDTCLLLCNQLLQMINNIEKWAETGSKGDKSNISYKMYLSLICLENSFMMTKWGDITSTTINVFVINGVTTSNESFCTKAEKWFNGIVERSLYISKSSKLERFKFFQEIRTKIRDLVKKIKNE